LTELELRGVAYRYPDGTDALRGVSLSVAAGACAAVVGPNGAGKTTLVSVLAGFLPARAGAVRVGDVELTPDAVPAVRARTGFLFSNPDDQLFMPTVLEDVCFGLLAAGAAAEEAKARALALMGELGIAPLASKFPGHLSAGEKRLATLAGALVTSPRLLVLDEPTAFLDPHARRQLMHRLARLPQTRLVITHDLELVVELCSKVHVLDGGAVVAEGDPAAVLGDEALMEAHRLERPHALAHRHPHR
jgi:cobalt/nickel transport system ATP-binding protein